MICWFENSNNDITSTASHVFFLSCMSSRNSGYYLDEKNFRTNISIYVAKNRGVINKTWVNDCDRYFAPSFKEVR